jgi:hypothetical protein
MLQTASAATLVGAAAWVHVYDDDGGGTLVLVELAAGALALAVLAARLASRGLAWMWAALAWAVAVWAAARVLPPDHAAVPVLVAGFALTFWWVVGGAVVVSVCPAALEMAPRTVAHNVPRWLASPRGLWAALVYVAVQMDVVVVVLADDDSALRIVAPQAVLLAAAVCVAQRQRKRAPGREVKAAWHGLNLNAMHACAGRRAAAADWDVDRRGVRPDRGRVPGRHFAAGGRGAEPGHHDADERHCGPAGRAVQGRL